MKREISNQKDLGSFVHDARTKLGLTQEVLAERAGVSRKWLIGLEQGARTRAELGKVFDTLEALGISINLSFNDGNQAEPENKDDSQRLPRLSPATLDAIKKVSSGSQSSLQKLASEGLGQSAIQRMMKEGLGQSAFQKLASEGLGQSAIQRMMKEGLGQSAIQRAIGKGLSPAGSSALGVNSDASNEDEHNDIQAIDAPHEYHEHGGQDEQDS